ncbi:hypothetical protein NST17_20650 [Caldifermentibacillus hisashii]|uniref:DUF3679 domain-containing protein n=1 Tax=Caldifermentibacillus hisashii TaxID=996558 RepID=A0ABU9K5I0_9BACI
MGEKLGFMTVLLIFSIAVIPTLFVSFQSHVEGSTLLNISTEMQQLVSAEGGVTNKVQNAVSALEKRGVDITIQDESGKNVTGKVPVGEKVVMTYKMDNFQTKNEVTILKR